VTAALLGGRPVGQVGILVKDLEQALESYASIWGLGPWHGYDYGPENIAELMYRGNPGDFRLRVALCGAGPQVELFQPVSGRTIYEEWIDRHGYGLHHLGYFVPSVRDAIPVMEAAGYELLQAGLGHGLHGDGGFAYFDTESALGVILEAIEVPSVRRPPDFTR
jgi:catechol 2,3-dioxygenase-like lactoylglutathione lyase family enzyme